jgi:hypothetical protein
MLVSSFNLSKSFNYIPSLLQNTVQIRDKFFLHMDPEQKKSLKVRCGIDMNDWTI